MDKLRSVVKRRSSYEVLRDDTNEVDTYTSDQVTRRFSWVEYSVFLLLGISMLWAWYVAYQYTGPPTNMQ